MSTTSTTTLLAILETGYSGFVLFVVGMVVYLMLFGFMWFLFKGMLELLTTWKNR